MTQDMLYCTRRPSILFRLVYLGTLQLNGFFSQILRYNLLVDTLIPGYLDRLVFSGSHVLPARLSYALQNQTVNR